MKRKPVELTEEEASLVLGNWWFSIEAFDGPAVFECWVPRRVANALNDVVSPHIFNRCFVADGADLVASCIRVVKRRERR